jgi:hypothetical protein
VGEPGGSVEFEDECFGVAVDDQPGQAVVLAVDKAIAVRVLRCERHAELRGGCEFFLKPIGVDDGGGAALQHAHADGRSWVVETDGEEFAFVIEDDGEITRNTRVALLGDGVLEDPRVSLTQGAFGGRSDVQCDAFFSRAREMRKIVGEIHWVDYTQHGRYPYG